jgi:hypothetical protein
MSIMQSVPLVQKPWTGDFKFLVQLCVLVNFFGGASFVILCNEISTNQGFVAYCRGCHGFPCHVDKLVSDLIVARDHKTTLLATESMLQGELGITTIAAIWEARWDKAISHRYGIPELLRQEFCPVDSRGWEE